MSLDLPWPCLLHIQLQCGKIFNLEFLSMRLSVMWWVLLRQVNMFTWLVSVADLLHRQWQEFTLRAPERPAFCSFRYEEVASVFSLSQVETPQVSCWRTSVYLATSEFREKQVTSSAFCHDNKIPQIVYKEKSWFLAHNFANFSSQSFGAFSLNL